MKRDGSGGAVIRRVHWLAAATDQGNLPARLTLDDVKRVEERAKAFVGAIAANPSPEWARKLAAIAQSARAQARRDKSEARAYIAIAVDLETLVRAIDGLIAPVQ